MICKAYHSPELRIAIRLRLHVNKVYYLNNDNVRASLTVRGTLCDRLYHDVVDLSMVGHICALWLNGAS